MSNIVPQSKDLNPDEWLALEDAHRRIVADPASGITELWVVCGPVFTTKNPRRIGNGIAVPDACYKLVAWRDGRHQLQLRAYLMPQDAEGTPADFLTSVDEVERLTGLDFFPDLDDATERSVESARPRAMWE